MMPARPPPGAIRGGGRHAAGGEAAHRVAQGAGGLDGGEGAGIEPDGGLLHPCEAGGRAGLHHLAQPGGKRRHIEAGIAEDTVAPGLDLAGQHAGAGLRQHGADAGPQVQDVLGGQHRLHLLPALELDEADLAVAAGAQGEFGLADEQQRFLEAAGTGGRRAGRGGHRADGEAQAGRRAGHHKGGDGDRGGFGIRQAEHQRRDAAAQADAGHRHGEGSLVSGRKQPRDALADEAIRLRAQALLEGTGGKQDHPVHPGFDQQIGRGKGKGEEAVARRGHWAGLQEGPPFCARRLNRK